ncbi:hypothetical protein [Streptomyces sp. OE57]|uniref:hypothetical protein n=1 Tax=Streptomyces lacaronensis TaxID=3379885 RepID=UPI0039B788A6
MRTRPASASLDIPHDDPWPRYRGAVSLRRGPGWTAPVREGHPTTLFAVTSTITAPEREEAPGLSGMTMRECRAHTPGRDPALLRPADGVPILTATAG